MDQLQNECLMVISWSYVQENFGDQGAHLFKNNEKPAASHHMHAPGNLCGP